jgi:hypothetical protein
VLSRCCLGILSSLTIFLPASAVSQWNPEPACDSPYGDVLTCGLRASGVRDLRDTRSGLLTKGERELRFWILGGPGDPRQLLAIHQRGDSVTGRLLLFWYASIVSDTFATALCSEEIWEWAGGSVCVGRLAAEPEWRELLGALDSLGLANLPGSPVPEAPCGPENREEGKRVDPLEALCVPTHTEEHVLEVGLRDVYWRYIFAYRPDTNAAGITRDRAILTRLSCAAVKLGDRMCTKPTR